MRIGMSIRISEEFFEATKLIAELYSKNYFNNIKHSNLYEKFVVNGIFFYIEDLKQIEAKHPNENIRHKLNKINELIEISRDIGTSKNKVICFITEKRLHMAIQEIAELESKYWVTTTYNALVGASLYYGLNFHIELLEKIMPDDKLEPLLKIKKYVNGLTDKVDIKYIYTEKDTKEEFDELYDRFSKKKPKKNIKETTNEIRETER